MTHFLALWFAFCPPESLSEPNRAPEVELSRLIEVLPELASADPDTIAFLRLAEEQPAFPAVWIGVRCTAIPAPLAAHVGERGLMISNIVAQSPADQAGLLQYDIVLEFNGRPLNEPGELVDAVATLGAGKAADVLLLRGGKEQRLRITPIERPENFPVEFKYDEPDEVVDRTVKMRGRSLRMGPDGEVIVRDLGSMSGLPGILMDLDEDVSATADADGTKKRFMAKFIGADGALTIERDEAGAFSVTRSNPGEPEVVARYPDEEAFAAADPKAHAEYQERMARVKVQRIRPDWNALPQLRGEFQEQIREQLQVEVERLNAARDAARSARDAAQQQAREMRNRATAELRRTAERGADKVEAEAVAVRINPDGAVSVEVSKNGNKAVYQFNSRKDFAEREPALYERVKSLLE